VARSGGDILRGVAGVAHAEARGCARHQLHQPQRARRAERARVEVRLLLHHAEDQIRVNAVARAVLPYERVEPRAARRPAPLAPPGLAVARARHVGKYPLALDVINARALDEGRDVAAFIPDALGGL